MIPKLIDEYTIHILDLPIRPSTLPKASNLIYHRGSILPPSTALTTLLSDQQFDGIIHLAAISLEKWCAPKEPECAAINIDGTRALIERLEGLAHRAGEKRWGKDEERKAPWILHGSSMDVFGDSTLVVDEESERRPTTVLGRTKLGAEQVIFQASGNLRATILRFANVYGYVHQSSIPSSFIPSLLSNSLTSLPIQFSSDFEPMDLLHVDDAIDGIIKAIERQETGGQVGIEAINLVGGGKRWLEEETVELVRTLVGSESPVRDTGDHRVNVRTTDYSNLKAKSILDWEPTIPLPLGLTRSVIALSKSISTYSRSYLATHCASTSSFPSVEPRIASFPEDERNKALDKLDGCTVNMGFDHAGWVHHVKCEDGRHCTADGDKVVSYNWNATVFLIRKLPVKGRKQKERTVRVMFEEEKGMGWLGIARQPSMGTGSVGFELFEKEESEDAVHLAFDVEVG